jgi:hypothetical protein
MTINLSEFEQIWRDGVAPHLPTGGLRALRAALERDDPEIIQGETVFPDIDFDGKGRSVQACCPIAYALLDAVSLAYIDFAELDSWFSSAISLMDHALGTVEGVRVAIETIDSWPRDTMRTVLIRLIDETLAGRESPAAGLAETTP